MRFKQFLVLHSTILTLLLFSSCQTENAPTYIACGGGIEFTCPPNWYCQMKDNCGGIDNKGYCKRMLPTCPEEEKLICGCDGNEYKNECIANTLGVSLKNTGPCIKEPVIEISR